MADTSSRRAGPLAGVKIVEFSVFMAGPAAGLMLADLGADVIKVERIPDGDDSRRMVPPAIKGEPAAFMIMNRNKRGIAVDLKTPGGMQVIRRLLKTADMVIENFRPGAMEKLGLGYDDLKRDNPGLIYGSISGFGSSGPLAARPGLDLIAQGWSGLMSITGEGPGRPPVKIGAPVSDTTAGMLLALGLVAAYVHRLKTGEGQRVETSLIEAAMAHTHWQAAIFLAEGKSAAPMGSAHPLSAPYQAFRCADGYLIVGAPSQTLWVRLVDAIGEPVLRDDARFRDNAARRKNLGVLVKKLSAVFVTRTRAAWIERLDTAGVPCGPVNTLGETLTHPHAKARDMVIEVAHARAGRVKALGCPLKFSGTPASTAKAAPSYGEDSVAVLRECGFAADEIDALLRDGAVVGDAGVKSAAR